MAGWMARFCRVVRNGSPPVDVLVRMRVLPYVLVLSLGPLAGVGCSAGSPAAPMFEGMSANVSTSGEDASADGEDASADAEVASAEGGSAGDAGSFAACKTNPTTGTIPTDVAAVLMARCQPCHQMPPLNGAPFPLLTYQDVNAAFGAVPIYQEMHVLIQPNGDPHMPYRNAPQLSPDQLQTLDTWLLSCAPPAK